MSSNLITLIRVGQITRRVLHCLFERCRPIASDESEKSGLTFINLISSPGFDMWTELSPEVDFRIYSAHKSRERLWLNILEEKFIEAYKYINFSHTVQEMQKMGVPCHIDPSNGEVQVGSARFDNIQFDSQYEIWPAPLLDVFENRKTGLIKVVNEKGLCKVGDELEDALEDIFNREWIRGNGTEKYVVLSKLESAHTLECSPHLGVKHTFGKVRYDISDEFGPESATISNAMPSRADLSRTAILQASNLSTLKMKISLENLCPPLLTENLQAVSTALSSPSLSSVLCLRTRPERFYDDDYLDEQIKIFSLHHAVKFQSLLYHVVIPIASFYNYYRILVYSPEEEEDGISLPDSLDDSIPLEEQKRLCRDFAHQLLLLYTSFEEEQRSVEEYYIIGAGNVHLNLDLWSMLRVVRGARKQEILDWERAEEEDRVEQMKVNERIIIPCHFYSRSLRGWDNFIFHLTDRGR